MRYAAAEKLEIIELVERSSLPIRRTLAQLGIPTQVDLLCVVQELPEWRTAGTRGPQTNT